MSDSIIIVDDEPDIAELFPPAISAAGPPGHLRHALRRSGEEALNCWGRDRAGVIVILSDINMPGMDGLQLLGKSRSASPICRS